jgi:hypothetical protein
VKNQLGSDLANAETQKNQLGSDLANIAKAKTEVDVQLLNSGRHLQNTEDVIGKLRLDLKNLETQDRNVIANLQQDVKFLTQEKELLLKRISESANF